MVVDATIDAAGITRVAVAIIASLLTLEDDTVAAAASPAVYTGSRRFERIVVTFFISIDAPITADFTQATAVATIAALQVCIVAFFADDIGESVAAGSNLAVVRTGIALAAITIITGLTEI
jgi:hypothetical protein